MEAEQIKAGAPGNTAASAIIMRTTSSPAGFFANLNVENGYGVMRGLGAGNNSGSGGNTGNSQLKGQLSFSSRQGSLMSQISEMESEGMDGSSPEGAGNSGAGSHRFPMNSWDKSSLLSDNFSGMNRARENHADHTEWTDPPVQLCRRHRLKWRRLRSSSSFRMRYHVKSGLNGGAPLILGVLQRGCGGHAGTC